MCGELSESWERTEELRDPRIEPEKDKGKEPELSPEAQKITGTDPASQKAKEKAKPKLEVDVSDKISILGKTGSGKTNLIKVLMSDILKDYYFVLLDSIGNFAEYEGKENIEYHQVVPSDTNTVDDIIYKALERGDCMVCVKPDTIILGDNRPIVDLKIGGKAIGRTGHNEIKQTFVRPFKGDMIRIKGSGLLPIEITPEHPILVSSRKMTMHQKGCHVVDYSELYWKPANQIQSVMWKKKGRLSSDTKGSRLHF